MNTQTRRARRQGLLIIQGGLIAAASLFLSTPTARADISDDYDMQQRLSEVGIPLSLKTARETGDAVCGYLHVDPTDRGVERVLRTYEKGFTDFQSGVILGAAVNIYCRDMSAVVNDWMIDNGQGSLPGYRGGDRSI